MFLKLRRIVFCGLMIFVTHGLPATNLLAQTVINGQQQPSPLAAAVNDCGFDLYRELVKDPSSKNLVDAPLSFYSVLMMATEGAQGRTESELLDLLRVGDEFRKSGSPLATFRSKLYQLNQSLAGQVTVGNLLCHDGEFALRPEFGLLLLSQYTNTKFERLDFKGDSESAANAINAWIANSTRNKIVQMIDPATLDPATRLMFVNAIVFEGKWRVPFPREMTREYSFTSATGKQQQAEMMVNPELSDPGAMYGAFNGDGTLFETPDFYPRDPVSADFGYPTQGGFQILTLPYQGSNLPGDNSLSLVIILPQKEIDLSKIESQCNATNLRHWCSLMRTRKISARLPKLKIESELCLGNELENSPLQKLGVRSAFRKPTENRGADFSRIGSSNSGTEGLYIGQVIQKIVLKMDESGTTAAAASAVQMRIGAPAPPVNRLRPFVPEFLAQRPFLFLIKDNRTGTILFLGRYVSAN